MNIFQRNVNKVVVMAVIAASFSSIFVRLTEAPPIAIGFYRLTFAWPIFAIITFGWHRAELTGLSRKKVAGCALAGIFLAGHFFSWFTGVGHTSVASATVLAMMHPLIILILSVLLWRERTNKKAIFGVVIAFVGGVIVSGGDYSISLSALFGDLMSFLAAFFMALYLITGNKFRTGISAAVYVFLVFSFCWVAFGAGMLITSTPFTGYSFQDIFWIFMMSMVCQIGAHAVFNWCLGYTTALYVATCENLETFIATAMAALLFVEIPTVSQAIGGLIIVAGVMYYTRHEQINANVDES
ncbi:DMT family transporter [Clostridium aminobutyricum]|uniref:DMT family transporter n=1 Tax=Clostridium aminobutyricum TaxID=33953 RepID=A0A939D8G4_CLOAM|nr:DMT family transporter [Clostridium aminobutyricum]MBN7773061.1 DMT family transporter [Clostridium aminobutyricum]